MPMKALVTGAAGFVGRHMSAELERRGYLVDRRDILFGSDAHIVFASKLASRYDLVVHAAASAPHRAAIDGQAEHFARNLHLDAAMFDWAVRTGQGRVLYLSSSAAYPIRLQMPEWTGANGERWLAEHLVNLTQWGKTGDWSPDSQLRLDQADRRDASPLAARQQGRAGDGGAAVLRLRRGPERRLPVPGHSGTGQASRGPADHLG
jgi:nucleoside-diphosphate-sugar epimerase